MRLLFMSLTMLCPSSSHNRTNLRVTHKNFSSFVHALSYGFPLRVRPGGY